MRTGWWCVVYGVGLVLWVVAAGYLAERSDRYTREESRAFSPLAVIWPVMLASMVICAAGEGLLRCGAWLANRRAAP